MAPAFKYEHRVTYSECTVGNHVYYSRYLDILETARGELFRSAGLSLLQLQQDGTAFPVIEVRIAYKGPARYDDGVTVNLWINELKGVRLSFGFQICHASGQVLAEGETRHVCASLDEKPKRLPTELIERFAPFIRVAHDDAG